MSGAERSSAPVFDMCFRSDHRATRGAVARLDAHIRRLPIGDECRDDVQIAVAEALNNVTEHAFGTATHGALRLSCAFTGDTLSVVIHDRGRAMPAGAPPTGTPPAPSEAPEGGFGWHLIRQLADGVSYVRTAECNTLVLTFRLAVSRPDLPAVRHPFVS